MTDRLLDLPEIANRTRMPEATIRYKRHRGELPFTFKLGRKVVAYESELDAWIAAQRAAQNDNSAA
ncbi:helix-turn-helix domain-containing protein [Kribbella sp. NPDC026596]|uniref:helix-turn-helix transcriptional regulator n=1 Tax=Kribbella sp. NPDC026596 TaxID=3155122 RepID=UPI003408E639